MIIQITQKWRVALKIWGPKKCNGWKPFLFTARGYKKYFENTGGFEVRILGFGFGVTNFDKYS